MIYGDRNSGVIVTGATGKQGAFHIALMNDYARQVLLEFTVAQPPIRACHVIDGAALQAGEHGNEIGYALVRIADIEIAPRIRPGFHDLGFNPFVGVQQRYIRFLIRMRFVHFFARVEKVPDATAALP